MSVFTLTLTSCHTNAITDIAKAKHLIYTVSKKSLKILFEFKSQSDLLGFVVQNKAGAEFILYTTQDGNYLIQGNIFDAKKDITKEDYQKYIQPKVAESAHKFVSKTTYIQQGLDDAPHKIWVIVDPNCSVCHMTFDKLQTAIKDKKLAVRWIMIGLLKPDSAIKAETILASSKPLQAMLFNENNFVMKSEEGGIKPLSAIPSKYQDQLKNNNQIFKKLNLNATPTFIYQTVAGIKKLSVGMQEDDTFYLNANNQW